MNFRRKAIIAVLLFDSIGVEAQEVTMKKVTKAIKKRFRFEKISVLKEDSIGHGNEIVRLKEANDAHVKAMADLLEMVESLSSCCSRTSVRFIRTDIRNFLSVCRISYLTHVSIFFLVFSLQFFFSLQFSFQLSHGV